MALHKDWIAEAAKELAAMFSFGTGRDSYVTDEQRQGVAEHYAMIIANHCPMKPNVAYMPVPRCESCALWKPRDDKDTGWCGLRELSQAKLWPEMYDGIITANDFGCVQWKEK